MRVLILAPGTRGDVAPASRLGAGFVEDGHDVTIVANAEYAPLVATADCAHVPVEAALVPEGAGSGVAGVREHLAQLRTYMRAAATSALEAADGAGAVLTSPISPYGHDIAESLGVPSATALLQPAEPSAVYPPMIASARDLGPHGNRLAGRLAQRVRTPYDPATAMVRDVLRLPPERPKTARARRRRAQVPVHHGISAAVLPRPADWPEYLHLDGFWWPLDPPGWEPSAELSAFLEEGPAPLLITLGSLETGAETTTAVRDVLAASAQRILVQGEEFQEVAADHSPRVLSIGDVPHSWLLPRTSGVVHQAGAGIAAASLRAGVPSIPVPLHTDQPFWARRLHELGAAVAPIPAKRVSVENLGAAMHRVANSEDLREGARAVAASLEPGDSTLPLRRWVNRADD